MYFVTGVAGFIGFNVVSALLGEGKAVLGIDIVDAGSGTWIQKARLDALSAHTNFVFARCDITDEAQLNTCVRPYAGQVTHVLHLAAQTGIRKSLTFPRLYAQSNIIGQLAMLEQYRAFPKAEHFVYASSSSVYGAGGTLPFKESDDTDHPLSLYAATKKSAEIITESYARLYNIPATCLRFFTVYGPWGRPDMAYFDFARKIMAGTPIVLFNRGNMRRDFTFIDDIVAGLLAALDHPPSGTPHVVYNLGSGRNETVDTLVQFLEGALGRTAVREYAPIQPGEMEETCADISAASATFGFAPRVALREGIGRFVQWYKDCGHAG